MTHEPCPVCGANEWKMMWAGEECLGYRCKTCGTTIPADRINDRVTHWVGARERLPEEGDHVLNYLCRGFHSKDARMTIERHIPFLRGVFWGTDIIITHWLEDKTEVVK